MTQPNPPQGEPDNPPADPPANPPNPTPPATDGVDYKALAEKAQADAEKWKNLARKHEDRARQNADAASKAKTVEEQLGELRKSLADRDAADVVRNGRLAKMQVQAKLAEAGFSSDDVSGLLEHVDTSSLLKDGEPDNGAIGKLAESLAKVGGRATPDRDQGRRSSSDAPQDMNSLIRLAAGLGSK